MTVIKSGVPGEGSASTKARLGELLVEHEPHVVIITSGGNDNWQLSNGNTKQNLLDMADMAFSVGTYPLIVAIPALGVGDRHDDPLYRELDIDHGQAVVHDVISDTMNQEQYRSEPIHPNAEGYAEIAKGVGAELIRWMEQWGVITSGDITLTVE